MAGTVLADTNVFAPHVRPEAVGARVRPPAHPGRSCRSRKQDSYTLHQWWFGTPPPTENNFAIIKGDVELLLTGIQLAGPKLTPETFRDGLYHAPPQSRPGRSASTRSSRTATTASGTAADSGGLDNAGILYWDPNGDGHRRDRHRRQGHVPARRRRQALPAAASGRPTPVKLFDPRTRSRSTTTPTDPRRAEAGRQFRCPPTRPPNEVSDELSRSRGTVTQPSPST